MPGWSYSWQPCVARSDKLVPSCNGCRHLLMRKFPNAMMVLSMEDGYRFAVSKYNQRRGGSHMAGCHCVLTAEGNIIPCWTHAR